MQTLAASCPGVAAGLLRRPRLEQQLTLRSIGGLIDHHRPPVRPVWPTRVDPAVRLHRWRGSGDPGEIRAHDLGFTNPETVELFKPSCSSRVVHPAGVLADPTQRDALPALVSGATAPRGADSLLTATRSPPTPAPE